LGTRLTRLARGGSPCGEAKLSAGLGPEACSYARRRNPDIPPPSRQGLTLLQRRRLHEGGLADPCRSRCGASLTSAALRELGQKKTHTWMRMGHAAYSSASRWNADKSAKSPHRSAIQTSPSFLFLDISVLLVFACFLLCKTHVPCRDTLTTLGLLPYAFFFSAG